MAVLGLEYWLSVDLNDIHSIFPCFFLFLLFLANVGQDQGNDYMSKSAYKEQMWFWITSSNKQAMEPWE